MRTGHHELLCGVCGNKQTRPHFDRAACAFRFEDVPRRLVLDYKFNTHIWMVEDFTDFLEGALRSRMNPDLVDVVLPMPSTAFHDADRGYNQSEILAKSIARRIGRMYAADVIERKGAPKRQAGLSAEERMENAKGTFAVQKKELVRGRTVLIVDDVLTTGATLSECALALKKEALAWRVWVLTLARALM